MSQKMEFREGGKHTLTNIYELLGLVSKFNSFKKRLEPDVYKNLQIFYK